MHFEVNVKLVLHEALWKKNFTVYPSLKVTSKNWFKRKKRTLWIIKVIWENL